jgi:uncharacterized RDD family membrane protein YckC
MAMETPQGTNGETPPPTPPPEPPAAAPPPPPAEPEPAPVDGSLQKADLGKRFLAALVDGVISAVVGFIPVVGGLAGAAYMLIRDGLEIDFMDQRSLGKKLLKLRPVRLDGQPMDLVTSVKRNIPFAIGPLIMVVPVLGWIIGPVVSLIIGLVEAILVLTDADGRRVGDRIGETQVVDVPE